MNPTSAATETLGGVCRDTLIWQNIVTTLGATMTHHAGSPFGASPSGGADPTPPPSTPPAGQSHWGTAAWVIAALALVVGLGVGGAAVVQTLGGAPDAGAAVASSPPAMRPA